MKIYEFLRKVTEIELSQVKYVFGDWDLALEEYVNKCEKASCAQCNGIIKTVIYIGRTC